MEHKVTPLVEADKSDIVDLHTLLLLIRDSITFYCGDEDEATFTRKVWSRQKHKWTVASKQPSLSRKAITNRLQLPEPIIHR